MGAFNLDDYAPVEERIGVFYEQHPEGRILTAVERLEPPLAVFRAEVYRDATDVRPWATGYAYEKENEGHVNKTSYIENCETSAIGRALANAGYHGRRDGAPRPSREEMQKVERMGGSPAPSSTPNGVKHSNVSGQTCPKCGGGMWDNRAKKASGEFKPTSPDFACKDKKCKQGVWLEKEAETPAVDAMTLQDALDAAAVVGAITVEQSARIEDVIAEADPDHMSAALSWLETQMSKRKTA